MGLFYLAVYCARIPQSFWQFVGIMGTNITLEDWFSGLQKWSIYSYMIFKTGGRRRSAIAQEKMLVTSYTINYEYLLEVPGSPSIDATSASECTYSKLFNQIIPAFRLLQPFGAWRDKLFVTQAFAPMYNVDIWTPSCVFENMRPFRIPSVDTCLVEPKWSHIGMLISSFGIIWSSRHFTFLEMYLWLRGGTKCANLGVSRWSTIFDHRRSRLT